MKNEPSDRYCPASRKHWRIWLEDKHISHEFVWLIIHKVSSGKRNLTWSEAVEEALCFGWIDGKKKTLDKDRYIQYFSKRKPKSTWSRINKESVHRLAEQGLMTEAGAKSVTVAKRNGSWSILDQVEDLIVPEDLAEAFKIRPGSAAFFLGLSASKRKEILAWLVLAKRQDTRDRRIKITAGRAEQGMLPQNFKR